MLRCSQVILLGFCIICNSEKIFAASNTTCGGTVSASASYRYITSPNYPHGSNSKVSCVWIVQSAPGKKVKVDFLNANIRTGNNLACVDSVKVFDGSLSSSPLLATVCGTGIPSFYSSGTSLRLEYKTVGPSYLSRFKLRYIAGAFRVCRDLSLVASSTSKYITSPGYPSYTSNFATCTFRIDAGSQRVNLTSTVFSLGNTTASCSKSFVKIYDGFDASYRLMGSYCGSRFPPLKSKGRYMYLVFSTDSSVRSKFKLQYKKSGAGSHSESSEVGAIAGGSVGAFVFIVILCVIVGVVLKKNQHNSFLQF